MVVILVSLKAVCQYVNFINDTFLMLDCYKSRNEMERLQYLLLESDALLAIITIMFDFSTNN